MAFMINTDNAEAISYQTEELGFTILGGIRLDGLDRLRVTMRIEVLNRRLEHYVGNPDIANLPVRHNLDLYNDVQVEKLIRKTAERLEVGVSPLTKAIADITSQLEQYRLQRIEQQQNSKSVKQQKILSPEAREAALQFFILRIVYLTI
ncbi:hypothetical protein [Sediminibacterium soli]|uniref:hypothetical protein n=1 Tax=Sediminibacterium soli TaxID=2698829 RepID=UPI00137945BF|nr:hypothetical protein [Sediminibacterium soli]NCI45796.1 hypothetical protein [Sediminibacterium soli]